MKRKLRIGSAGTALLAFALTSCGGSASQDEVERLREEVERLRSEVGGKGGEGDSEASAAEVPEPFRQDAAQGTLAGLQPGDTLAQARERFGQETRSRSWTDRQGRRIFQHEWELEGGLVLRLNADGRERLEKVAVALDGTQEVDIPVVAGLRLGQETFASIKEKFGAKLEINLQLWGAQGLYTVTQRTLIAGNRRRLEFAYQMPEGLSRSELDEIGYEVQQNRNAAVLEPHLNERTPFLMALEAVR